LGGLHKVIKEIDMRKLMFCSASSVHSLSQTSRANDNLSGAPGMKILKFFWDYRCYSGNKFCKWPNMDLQRKSSGFFAWNLKGFQQWSEIL